MTIACIVPDITNPFYPSLIRGIQSVTDGLSYDVIAVNTDGLPSEAPSGIFSIGRGRAGSMA